MEFNKAEYARLKTNYEDDPDRYNLQNVRKYLDSCGYRMPSPMYRVDRFDQRTWRYLDVTDINGKICGVENPDFKFKVRN